MGKASKQVKPQQRHSAETATTQSATKALESKKTEASSKNGEPLTRKELIASHLPPFALVLAVMTCSGILFVFAMRDVFSTGRNIAGSHDEAMLYFTKSIDFFENTKGWKSTQGGLSAIKQFTTDANNMGGLFVRKVGGAASMFVHVQKLMPLLFHPLDARWKMGHFRPLLWVSLVSNLAIASFYATYMSDLVAAGADVLPKFFVAILIVESLVFMWYLVTTRKLVKGPAVALTEGKTPTSVPSRIVARTVLIVSTLMSFIAGRDLLFPGQIMDFIPRDDIYLEWTGAFLHSPPEGSPEADENGMTSALYVGDKFLSQFLALHILLLSLYKVVSAVGIRYGSDGGGEVKARMIWKAQALADCLLLFLFRLFSPAALTASLDLRWHLMCIAYEAFILGLYGFL